MSKSYFSHFFIHRWMLFSIGFFFLSAIAGLLMRYFFVGEISILKYKYVLHAHSHTALLGWGFLFLTGGFLFYLLKEVSRPKTIEKLFYAISLSVLGMYISFLLEGYGAWSITLSALFILLSFWLSFILLDELKGLKSTAALFAGWAIVWYLASTIGVWAIAPIGQLLGKLHPAYFASVQFFLHFQFNGWFTYGALALLYHFLAQNGYETKVSQRDFILLQFSVLSTYALSITWSTPLDVLFYLNAAGVAIQFFAIANILKPALVHVFKNGLSFKLSNLLLTFGVGGILLKVLIQFFVAFPFIAVISYTIRQYVIGFIHLIMLGSFTFLVGGILLGAGILKKNTISTLGWIALLLGFISSEFILFGQGTLLWMKAGIVPYYYELLFGFSILLPVGTGLLMIGNQLPDKLELSYK